MNYLGYSLGGGQAVILDYKLAATVVEGQPVLGIVAGGGGYITDPTTTSLAEMVGLVLSASNKNPETQAVGSLTYSTTQAATEGIVRVVTSPDAVFEARMSGGAAVGTNLTRYTNTTADTTGVTFTADVGTASMDEGVAWITAGNNVGLSRRITTFTASTSFVVTVPWPRTLSTSDVALIVPYRPAGTATMQLTTDFTEANAAIAVGTGAEAACLWLDLNDRENSYIQWVARDHFFAARPT